MLQSLYSAAPVFCGFASAASRDAAAALMPPGGHGAVSGQWLRHFRREIFNGLSETV